MRYAGQTCSPFGVITRVATKYGWPPFWWFAVLWYRVIVKLVAERV
jgi:hypothetical protein